MVQVVGLDLSGRVSDAKKAQFYEAWLDYGVLLFQSAAINTEADAEMQVELTKWFGGLLENKDNYAPKPLSVEGPKELIEVGRGGTPMSPSFSSTAS